MFEARLRAERARGTLDARPLVQMAGPAVHDVRWPGLPMALYSKAAVVESGDSSAALQAVARVESEEWRKGSRKSRERQVERALSPVWVATVIVKRSARMLAHLDGGSSDGIYLALLPRLLALVAQLPTAWAVPAVRMYVP